MAAVKQSTVGGAERKQSVVPARKQSVEISTVRKPSLETSDQTGRKASLAVPGMMDDGEVGHKLSVDAQRRPSFDRGRRPSIFDRKQSVVESMGRSTLIMTSAPGARGNIRYENTYKVEPDHRFPSGKVKKIAYDILESSLKDKVYDKDECTRLSQKLSDTIKQNIKALGYNRFKIVVIVAIGQQQGFRPSVSFTSRCLWNDKYDTFSEAVFKNSSLYAVALCYGVYTD
ncbi:hypothetical protein ACJMK2_042145 [Sinanodonta woodiana]|uniref:Uncharacterized protein n=1 Tax=Sinanodonta woodiana TaxID=1069815 RepID=A0ABD3W9M9_SINWO